MIICYLKEQYPGGMKPAGAGGRVGERDVRAVVVAVEVGAVPAAGELPDPLDGLAGRAQRVLRGARPARCAGAGPAGAGVGGTLGDGLRVAGDDPQEPGHRPDLRLRVAEELERDRGRGEDVAEVAVLAAAGLLGVGAGVPDVPQHRPEVDRLVAVSRRSCRRPRATRRSTCRRSRCCRRSRARGARRCCGRVR